MKRLVLTAVLTAATSAAGSASAEEPPTPAASASSPAPSAEAPRADKTDGSRDVGFAASVAADLLLPGGEVVDGVDAWGSAAAVDLRVGYYASPRVGILGGLRYGRGHAVEGCDVSACGGYSLQIPVVAEFALTRRTNGAYLQAGFGFFSRYATEAPGAKATATSLADVKLAVGYRLPVVLDKEKGTGFLLDLHGGVDVGRFSHLSVEADGQTVAGPIPDGALAVHHTATFGVGFGF